MIQYVPGDKDLELFDVKSRKVPEAAISPLSC